LKQAETAHAAKSAAPAADFELEPEPPSSTSAREWVDAPGAHVSVAAARRWQWPQLSLVPAAALVAAIVAVGYGVYLYFALLPPPATPVAAHVSPVVAAVATPLLPVPASAPAAVETLAAVAASDKPSPSSAPPPMAQRASTATARASARPARQRAPAMIQAEGRISALNLAYDAYQNGRLDDAQRLDALQGLAAVAVGQNRSDDAARLYHEILERDPQNAAAQAELLNLEGAADPLRAESRLKALIERDPQASLYQSLGELYAAQRRWPEAQAAYFEAVRAAPDNADYAFNLAVSLEHLHQGKAALPYYQKALSLSASNAAARFDRALAEARVRHLGVQP
jgi:hypothetical protein